MKLDQHGLHVILKREAETLGRSPTRLELLKHPGTATALRAFYSDNYSKLLEAVGLEVYHNRKNKIVNEPLLIKKYVSLCAKKEQIQGFFRHTLDLSELFKRAGNPAILKMSAMPDTHCKYRDHSAVRAYMKFLKYFAPDVHLILGDFADCEGISHWPSDSLEPRRLIPEMKEARQLLGEIVEATPTATTRIFLEGNHENWIQQAFTRMPELFDGLEDLGIELNLKTLLALEKYGYELFPLNHIVTIGKANFTHGIYTGPGHPKKHLSVFKDNMYYGHLHDVSESNETSMNGSVHAASLGCLCKLDAKFLKGKPNNWVHASGVFEFFPDGSYNFYKPLIYSGRMAFNGQIFDGNI